MRLTGDDGEGKTAPAGDPGEPVDATLAADLWRVAVDAIRRAGWAPLVVFIAHAVLSLVFHAYVRWPGLDIPMHILGGAAMAWFLRAVVLHPRAEARLGRNTHLGRGLMLVGLTCIVAVLWECAEWSANEFLGTHINIDLADSLADILFGLAGATVTAARRQPSSFGGP